jgi:hypothetical protein
MWKTMLSFACLCAFAPPAVAKVTIVVTVGKAILKPAEVRIETVDLDEIERGSTDKDGEWVSIKLPHATHKTILITVIPHPADRKTIWPPVTIRYTPNGDGERIPVKLVPRR